jgi:prolipoprotein diacylglyceryltransferase
MLIVYFIISVVFMFLNIFIYYRYYTDSFHKDDLEETTLIGILSIIVSCFWPIEIILCSLILVGLWAQSIRKQAEEKKNQEKEERYNKERENREHEFKNSCKIYE